LTVREEALACESANDKGEAYEREDGDLDDRRPPRLDRAVRGGGEGGDGEQPVEGSGSEDA
jgi:hypothetical protein